MCPVEIKKIASLYQFKQFRVFQNGRYAIPNGNMIGIDHQ